MFEGKKVKVLLSQAGSGKGLPVTSKILTKKGFIQLKDLQLYDKVISPVDGKEYPVTGIYNRGYRHVNKITFTNHTSIKCDDDHLWDIQTENMRRINTWKTVSMDELKQLKLKRQCVCKTRKISKHCIFIPISCPVEFGNKVEKNAYKIGINYSKHPDILSIDDILTFSIESRRELLAGILDTTGHVEKSNKIWTRSKSECASVIKFLISSLGGCVTENRITKDNYHEMSFWLPEGINVKAERYSKHKKVANIKPYKAVESIEDAGFAECMCIYIDSPDHLFVVDDWIVTHNTSALMAEIENELKTRRSEEVAFVTYTRKGVEEGVRRTCNAMNLSPDDLPYFCTLHALTFRALGYKRDQVFNRIQQNKFNKKYGYNLNICEVGSRYNVHPTKDTEYFDIYAAIRSGSITSEQYASSEIDMEYLHHFAHDYEEFKAQECLTDFTDCLVHYVQNGVTLPVKVAIVDECFSPETEVRMADGSIKEIKNIEVGDKVQGTKGSTTVIAKHEGIDTMFAVTNALDGNVLFKCNSKHLLQPFPYNVWVETEVLYYKDSECYVKMNGNWKKCAISEQHTSEYVGITVDAEDSLFVLANGCVVHNCQDITALQWKVIEIAFAKAEKIFMAGDENQCLYTYNGARPDFLINFAKQFPTEYLSISHRIPKQVYYLAKGIVDLIDDKTEKPFDMKKENVTGKIVQIDNFERLLNFIDVDSLDDKKETEWYIICRNNCYLEEPKDMLEENLIPYWTSDGFFMDGEILRRIKDYYNFGLKGYKTEKKKKEFAEKFNIVDFNLPFTESNLFTEHKKFVYYNFVECYGIEKLEEMCKWNPQILVSSIHHVKGGEARNVALLLDTTRKVDINLYNKIDEELRVLYVAVTRTKENLILIDSSHGKGYGKIIETIKEENGLGW